MDFSARSSVYYVMKCFLLLRAAQVEKGQVKNPELTQGSNIDQIEKRETF